MVNTELLLVSVLRSLVEVAGFFLLGQGLLYVLAGASREKNGVYQLFRIVTRPVLRIVRFITPRLVIDRHIPVVAFFLLFWLWIALAYARRMICAANGLVC
ncbi:MAG: hypothetical protein HYU78_08700 [Rhodocyclales bacterium]|nr:hypothetical protein [Rhodocyclales bacterium]